MIPLRPRWEPLLAECVEQAVRCGCHRVAKHDAHPALSGGHVDALVEEIKMEFWSAVDERFEAVPCAGDEAEST